MSKREMLINYVPGEECRIAIVEDGKLEELYQERASAELHVGNIYKGRVVNVEPSIQAAFIDFGLERNGFLHISDVHPMYFPGKEKEETETVGLKTPRRDRPPIQRCFRRGQDVLVQVLKEGIGTKGPTLTSYLSIPGRYLVMMPNMERMGVSRKVDDDEARRESRDILNSLKPPEGFGFIIRTAGIGRNKTDLKRDLAYLTRLWKTIDQKMKTVPRVGELYTESDLVIRTIRDVYTTDIERIIVDDQTAAARARDFLTIANPRSGSNVLVYKDPVPLFHRYDLERQIETINARTVPLPSGGSLIIDQTEALVAIDVNSGKSRESRDAETSAYKTNLEAVDEICRQLRLRDLGGVVVNDLIDMRNLKYRRDVEARFKLNLKRDRARTRTAPISEFGVLEMTRQRMRPSLKKSIYAECPACQGQGHVKSGESVVLDVMRRLALVMYRKDVARVELTISPDVAFQLLNRKRGMLVDLEHRYGKSVLVRVNGSGSIDFVELAAFDERGSAVEAEARVPFGEPLLEAPPPTGEMIDLGDEDLDDEEPSEMQEGAALDAEDKRREAAVNEAPLFRSDVDILDRTAMEDDSRNRTGADARADSDGGEHSAHHVEHVHRPERGPAHVAPPQPGPVGSPDQLGEGGGRRRRRRRRGGRGRNRNRGGQPMQPGQPGGPGGPGEPHADDQASPVMESDPAIHNDEPEGSDPTHADEIGESGEPMQPVAGGQDDHGASPNPGQPQGGGNQPQGGGHRRRRRRGGRGRGRRGGGPAVQAGGQPMGGPADHSHDNAGPAQPAPVPPAPAPALSRGYRNVIVNRDAGPSNTGETHA